MLRDPRWTKYFTIHPVEVLVALEAMEDFEANLNESFEKGLPARDYADQMVSFLTDGVTPFAVHAALHKLGLPTGAVPNDRGCFVPGPNGTGEIFMKAPA